MANESFSIDGLVRKMKNEAPVQKEESEGATNGRGEFKHREPQEKPRPVGRPKNKRALINKNPKTSYFDDGTHQRIYARCI